MSWLESMETPRIHPIKIKHNLEKTNENKIVS